MDDRGLYRILARLGRPPAEYPLLQAVYRVLLTAPASRHVSEENLISQALDALDYLQSDGRWRDDGPDGTTELFWDGERLHVTERDDGSFRFERAYRIDAGHTIEGRVADAADVKRGLGAGDPCPGPDPWEAGDGTQA